LILIFEMLMGVRSNQNIMFAHLRSLQANHATVAINMRDHCRNQRPLLTGLDLSNPTVAGTLAEIYMREFACMLQTLKQVNWIASKYHEYAFDNTDAYIEGQGQHQRQLQTHEMTTEQRHAAQLLLGVGNSYSEINVALKMLECDIAMRDIMACDAAVAVALAKQFQTDPRVSEDAFDRLNHITKQVWSLVNLLAFSNLFRFADPAHPIRIANPEDSIFIPHIPTQPLTTDADKEPEPAKTPTHAVKFDPSRHVCNDCGKTVDTMKMHHRMGPNPTDAYLCHSCGFKRNYPDEYRQEFPDEDEDDEPAPAPAPAPESESDNDDEANATYWLKTVADWTAADRSKKSEMNAQTMNTPREQRTYFKEIAEMLADEKITTERACSLIEDLRDAGITAEVMHSHHEQEKGFKEIAELLADRKITTEEACGLFTEWMTEWSGWLL